MLSNFTYVIHNDKIKTTHILVDLLDCIPPSPAKEIITMLAFEFYPITFMDIVYKLNGSAEPDQLASSEAS